MTVLETLLDTLPDATRDLRLNVGSLLESTSLSLTQRWGVVVACALSAFVLLSEKRRTQRVQLVCA